MIASIADLVAFLKRFHRRWLDDPSLDPALIPADLPPGARPRSHGPSAFRRAQTPVRTNSASPAATFTPAFFSHASMSAGKMRSPGAMYGTPLRRAMSYSTARVTMPVFIRKQSAMLAATLNSPPLT